MDDNEMYAISYYGEKYKLGYIEMDFLDCNAVNNYIEESKTEFWTKVKIISVDVPYYIYKKFIGEKKKTFEDGSLFVVTFSNKDPQFECYEYFEDNSKRIIQLKITKSIKCDEALRNKIVSGLKDKFDIAKYHKVMHEEMLHKIKFRKNKKYKFKVYNVGQALATSIQLENNKPFIYFDYGWDAGNMKMNCESVLQIDENSTVIFLSHVDEDHWSGAFSNKKSLKCMWIVPRQNGHAPYQKHLANIIVNNGVVYWHDNDINLGSIYFGNSKKSKINNKRNPKTTHQDGYAMYINAYEKINTMVKKIKITVSGDQDYDYQDDNKYQKSDVLVACHHGGKYCWSKKFTGINPSGEKSVIIYSYGAVNCYNHPSKTSDYLGWGWKIEHRTPVDKTYEKDIFLKE